MFRHLLLLPFALIATHSAPALAESDFQQWLTASAKTDIGESVAVQGEAVARFGDASDGLYEIENSLLFGYKLTGQVTAWAGYVHNPTYDAGNFLIMERRARAQVTVDNLLTFGSVTMSGRLRFEQRWRDRVDGTGWRVRPYLKAAIPLGDKSAPVLNLTAEPFVNLNTTLFQSRSGLDRIRSAVLLSFPVAKGVKLEAGYLNQHRFVRNGEDRGDHAVTAALALSF